ncbi:MAG: transglutaminase domain-containing protein [Chloroflexi bacterium]|nr:transglutaminase domain-containing protein [Chloroflexota bacterium]MBM4449271.1 transglutaminase domain-containing protein [Chloroflexota bacterium]
MKQMERFLMPTPAIDCDHPSIIEKARALTAGKDNNVDKAISLFYFVRDEIKYNMYVHLDALEHYRASTTLDRKEGFCIQKAVLLVALARASGIPARLHHADIRNHLASDKAVEVLRTNVFAYHGYTELYTGNKWAKATPAFDLQTCQENGWIPVEFDGQHDAILHPRSIDGKLHIEYITDYGTFDDLPINDILTSFDKFYNLATTLDGWNGLVAEEKARRGAKRGVAP